MLKANKHSPSQTPNSLLSKTLFSLPGGHQDEVSTSSDHVCQGSAELDHALELGVLLAHGLDHRLVLGLASAQDGHLRVAASQLGQGLFLDKW
jgi:hypothetical protein